VKPSDFTHHAIATSGDALDLLIEQTVLLRDLFAKWNAMTPERTMRGNAASAEWGHGTVGKILFEHAAIGLTANQDIARVLRNLDQTEKSSRIDKTNHLAGPTLGQMCDNSRGVRPISVAIGAPWGESSLGDQRAAERYGREI
jgi:hypothetical protein